MFSDWSPPRTLRGELQRGLGGGFLHALNAPPTKVHRLLQECIEQGPLWDRQLDRRDWYYGALAAEVGLPLGPLSKFIAEHDEDEDDAYLARSVVGQLALPG